MPLAGGDGHVPHVPPGYVCGYFHSYDQFGMQIKCCVIDAYWQSFSGKSAEPFILAFLYDLKIAASISGKQLMSVRVTGAECITVQCRESGTSEVRYRVRGP